MRYRQGPFGLLSLSHGVPCRDLQVHALLTPTSPTLPWDVTAVSTVDPVTMFLNDVMTVPASLAGLPAMSVPVGFAATADGVSVPVGLQIIGRAFDEGMVARVGGALEACAGFQAQLPPQLGQV